MSGECMLNGWIDEEEADNDVNEEDEDDREPSVVSGGEVRGALWTDHVMGVTTAVTLYAALCAQ